ncbi:hypothetical protein [Vulcanococcus limneticus]|uniref:hypothetical protein n=1 Tax=Vulcanococcus limneticus TaxID=2170428 RepID=UPI000B999024|nr:hypothetical protein [Vulcanococcus limneticus]MCP9790552.1 hypothetical protein [Vulcanococcus limneticus MW73D5]MCP9892631.1 hypothetical protein [Vulcanococcus limneticus Candia 3F8]MCP9896159.1 hypothetical protein [Vulcanococcus limneticus Candia 3B3]
MSSLSPEQALVLTAIERFLADPDLVADQDGGDDGRGGGGGDGDVLEAIALALTAVLPVEAIEQAITSLLASHGAELDDDIQQVLEALLGAIERDDSDLEADPGSDSGPDAGESALQRSLAGQAAALEANALDGNCLLVWDEQLSPPLQELEILDLLDEYPCRGDGARWSPEDFVVLLEAKSRLWQQTMAALEIFAERPESRSNAATMLAVVPTDPERPIELMEVLVPLTGLAWAAEESGSAAEPQA